jgi:hypothetical protein
MALVERLASPLPRLRRAENEHANARKRDCCGGSHGDRSATSADGRCSGTAMTMARPSFWSRRLGSRVFARPDRRTQWLWRGHNGYDRRHSWPPCGHCRQSRLRGAPHQALPVPSGPRSHPRALGGGRPFSNHLSASEATPGHHRSSLPERPNRGTIALENYVRRANVGLNHAAHRIGAETIGFASGPFGLEEKGRNGLRCREPDCGRHQACSRLRFRFSGATFGGRA